MAASNKKLSVIIPMAGFGKRMRPHTWSKPKPLVRTAGKTVLDHILDIVSTAADLDECSLAFIVGYLGDQVRAHMAAYYPTVETNFYEQKEMLGQTHAIALARQHMHGPTMVLFTDTMVEDDMSFLDAPLYKDEGVIWVKKVEDPRRFGVVEVDQDKYVTGIIEKPDSFENDLAVVGYYYFPKGEDLMDAIDTQLNNKMITKGEYYIADAMKLMIERGTKLHAKEVEVWLDAGLPDAVIEANHYLLGHGRDNSSAVPGSDGVEIIPPVYIDPAAEVKNSKIGPYASVGPGCQIEDSQISEAVIEEGSRISGAKLCCSLVGERAEVSNISGKFIIGDDSTIKGE